MKRIYTVVLHLLVMSIAQAQIGIGTTQPDTSAALDISSAGKGLLIPRLNLAAGLPSPAYGLMVFNNNPNYGGGIGLYINTGTAAAPNWVHMTADNAGNFIRNQASSQDGNFNISGRGVIGRTLQVGVVPTTSGFPAIPDNSAPLVVQAENTVETGLVINNTNHFAAHWYLSAAGSLHPAAGSFALRDRGTGATPLIATGTGMVGINKSSLPTATLDVNGDIKGTKLEVSGAVNAGGDIKTAGSFLMDVQYLTSTGSVSGNIRQQRVLACPPGYQIISGGGGHRDFNSAASDIQIMYNGPDPDAPSKQWRLILRNTSSSSRAVIMYCNCAKVK